MEDEIIFEDNEICAIKVHAPTSCASYVEVRSTDHEILYGFLQEDAGEMEIKAAYSLYKTGYKNGVEVGKEQARIAMRNALGIKI